jgi:hypothetical protein
MFEIAECERAYNKIFSDHVASCGCTPRVDDLALLSLRTLLTTLPVTTKQRDAKSCQN